MTVRGNGLRAALKRASGAGLAALMIVALGACSENTTATHDGGLGDGAVSDGSVSDAQTQCRPADPPAKGTCATEPMEAFKGQHKLVISRLLFGDKQQGFDLNNADCDDDVTTGVDNVLWTIGAVIEAQLSDSMSKGEIVIPWEIYGLDDVTNDQCVNLGAYLGLFPVDADDDGRKSGGPLGSAGPDCNDTDKEISDQQKEIPGNGVDDDCDGLADEDESQTPAVPSSDETDKDGDGQTIKDGDCDDRPTKGVAIKLGATEICGDGLDNDCNGKADDGCMPWSAGESYPIDVNSLAADQKTAVVRFTGATIKDGRLKAGPATFNVSVGIKNATFDLNLSYVFLDAQIKAVGQSVELKDALLGGVLSARVLDQAPNLIAELGATYGNKDDSLFDALLGPIGQIIGLPKDAKGNRLPDVDVDGDGLEKFVDTDLDGDTKTFRVDTCIDGDGTVVKDKLDTDGKTVLEHCTQAKDAQGNYRFVDGWSISIIFDAVPTTFAGTAGTPSK
ncbi:MAG: putative metal-binding motif-containing protein [Deltaproteobacteria bacterium]|nr:putative metal-binding motif-containing protein [Deltaproteobacteria bacterium]